MPRGLIYAPRAREDLDAIRGWLTQPGSGPAARRRLAVIRAAINRLLAFASVTRADACRTSQTFKAPTRTNVMPNQTLVEPLIMVGTNYSDLCGVRVLRVRTLALEP